MYKLNIPLGASRMEELNDCFIDGKLTPEQHVREKILIDIGIEGRRMRDDDEQLAYNALDDAGRLIQKTIERAKISYLTLPSNQDWLPGRVPEDAQVLEIRIGDNLFDRLEKFASVIATRLNLFAASQDAYWEKLITEAPSSEESARIIEQTHKAAADRINGTPSCVEEVIHAQIAAKLAEKLEARERGILEREAAKITELDATEPAAPETVPDAVESP